MKKVLVVINFDVGLYNFRREVLEAFLAVPYEVHIALPYGSCVDKLTELGCIYHETRLRRRGTNVLEELALIRRYNEVLCEVRPDIVLTYTIKPNIYMGILCGLKKIKYITNITGLGTAVEGDGLLQKFTIRLYKIAMRRAECLFFQNATNEELFTKKKILPQKHIMLPGSGVNLDKFRYLEYPKEDTIEFLFISRILKEKGIEQYLDMAQAIKKKYPNTVFHILGFCEDDYEGVERFQALQENGTVVFHGMVTDVISFLQKSQCTIHPSFYPEGMSNVCLESAASGRPVITTKRPGCADTIEDGVTGFLVEERSSEDLIEKVERFLALSVEEREQMGKNARKRMEAQFDRRIVIERYLSVLEKTIGK